MKNFSYAEEEGFFLSELFRICDRKLCGEEGLRTDVESFYERTDKAFDSGLFLPLIYLYRVFCLSPFEKHTVAMAFYCEISGYEEPLTVRKLIRTFERYAEPRHLIDAFAPNSALSKFLLNCTNDTPLNRRDVALDARVVRFIGEGVAYEPYGRFIGHFNPVGWTERLIGYADVVSSIKSRVCCHAEEGGKPCVIHLRGAEGSGRRHIIRKVLADCGKRAVFVDFADIEGVNEKVVNAVVRECLLLAATPVLVNVFDGFLTKKEESDVFYGLFECIGLVFAVSYGDVHADSLWADVHFLSYTIDPPNYECLMALWANEAAGYKLRADISLAEMANKFDFTPGNIKTVLRTAYYKALSEDEDGVITKECMRYGCNAVLAHNLGKRAVKMRSVYDWSDLILPVWQKKQLKVACDQVKYKRFVYEKWGFAEKIAYGKGISMVFSGSPGTGKTMAAQVMAKELSLELYKIELAAVVSKYIGETEKNLEEIFEEGRKSSVILFFDEADVIFSKRTEIKDSNDKYSNMEAAFMLQKMEEYDGVTILATNFMQNFDDAFRRRIKFLIDFPFPAEKDRKLIWRNSIPSKLPVSDDIDFDFLSKNFELSGSHIKNILLHGAFLAAAAGSSVDMRYIVHGIRNEYAKIGKTLLKKDLGEYHMYLD